MILLSKDVFELPSVIYEALRASAPDRPWVSLLAIVLRERAEGGGYLTPMMGQRIVWDGAGCASEPNLRFPAHEDDRIFEYFREDFDVAGWTRVVLRSDLDGANFCSVAIDLEGPPASDYVGGWEDPFWRYLDEHRAELDELGRRYYGTVKRGLFRR